MTHGENARRKEAHKMFWIAILNIAFTWLFIEMIIRSTPK